MKLEQSFEVAAPLEQVWRTLIDVEHVAPCLPGAAVTGRNEDGSYNGTFTVKIGPTTASYTGKLEMENVDEAAHTATMQAQGTDKRGQGGAKATINSRVVPADGVGTRVDVVTDYHITGRLARFGRGGMIEDISERLLREFAKRLQSSLAAQPAAEAAPATEAMPAAEPAPLHQEAAPPEPAPLHQEAAPPEPAPLHQEAAPPEPAPSPVEAAAEAPTEVVPPSEPPTPAAPPFEPPAPEPAAPEPATAAFPPPSPAPEPPLAAAPPPPPAVAPPPPPAAAPPPPPGAGGRAPLENPPLASEPMQGLSLMGSVVWGRVKRNPAPVAAAGVAVVLLMARRRRRRAWH
jgi:carbon monoxide dehydrogenase subunit G